MTAALPFKVCFQTHEVPPSAPSTQQLPGHRHNPGRQHQGGAGRLSPRGSAMAAPTTPGSLLWGRRHLGRGPGGGERSGAERRGHGRLPGGGRGNGPGGGLRPRCGVPRGWRGAERLQAPALPVAVAQAETKPGPCRAGGAAAAGGTSPRCGGR